MSGLTPIEPQNPINVEGSVTFEPLTPQGQSSFAQVLGGLNFASNIAGPAIAAASPTDGAFVIDALVNGTSSLSMGGGYSGVAAGGASMAGSPFGAGGGGGMMQGGPVTPASTFLGMGGPGGGGGGMGGGMTSPDGIDIGSMKQSYMDEGYRQIMLMVNVQQAQRQIDTISNIIKCKHDATMNTIRNIKSG